MSGPLLDRFDLIIDVPRLKKSEFVEDHVSIESSDDIFKRVKEALNRQYKRYGQSIQNGHVSTAILNKQCSITVAQKEFLGQFIESGRLTARSCTKLIKVAQTIADLTGDTQILDHHLTEAFHYRLSLD